MPKSIESKAAATKAAKKREREKVRRQALTASCEELASLLHEIDRVSVENKTAMNKRRKTSSSSEEGLVRQELINLTIGTLRRLYEENSLLRATTEAMQMASASPDQSVSSTLLKLYSREKEILTTAPLLKDEVLFSMPAFHPIEENIQTPYNFSATVVPPSPQAACPPPVVAPSPPAMFTTLTREEEHGLTNTSQESGNFFLSDELFDLPSFPPCLPFDV